MSGALSKGQFGVAEKLFGVGGIPKPPTRDDEAVAEARRKELQAEKLRKGRSSTILTGPSGLTGDSLAPAPTLLGA